MSKTGQWVFEMQEDAYDMTLEEDNGYLKCKKMHTI